MSRNTSNDWEETPAPHRSNRAVWIVLLIVGLGGAALLVCCGGAFLLFRFGSNVLTAEIEGQLRDNAVLRENVGEIQTFEIDWTRSVAEARDNVFVYNVTGTKGTGVVTVEHVTNDNGYEEVKSAQLRKPSGETVDLVP